MRDTVGTLIGRTYTTNAAGFEVSTDERTEVFLTLRPIARTEFYTAHAAGLKVDLSALIRSEDYTEQETMEVEGYRYRVIRVYEREDGYTELTLQRSGKLAASND